MAHRKAAAILICLTVICVTSLLWPIYKEQAVRRELVETARLYRIRAEPGDSNAHHLGVSYYKGEGLPQDYGQAVRWYCKAANQGYAKAQRRLAASYVMGKGVPQDYAQAVRWYRRAADQGALQAQRSLDSMSPRPAFGRTQYILLSIVLLASLWLSLEFMLPGRSLRDLRQIVFTVVGASGLALVGVALYAMWHPAAIATFYLIQRPVAGISVAAVIGLRLMPRRRGDGN